MRAPTGGRISDRAAGRGGPPRGLNWRHPPQADIVARVVRRCPFARRSRSRDSAPQDRLCRRPRPAGLCVPRPRSGRLERADRKPRPGAVRHTAPRGRADPAYEQELRAVGLHEPRRRPLPGAARKRALDARTHVEGDVSPRRAGAAAADRPVVASRHLWHLRHPLLLPRSAALRRRRRARRRPS